MKASTYLSHLPCQSVTRVLSRKHAMLLKTNKNRRVHPDLNEFVEWLFSEIGRPEDRCRRECMYMFSQLASFTNNVTTPVEWIQKRVMQNYAYIVQAFEGKDFKVPSPSEQSTGFLMPLEESLHFFSRFTTSLDCYTWFFSSFNLTPVVLFDSNSTSRGVLASKTKLFESLRRFVHSYAIDSKDVQTKLSTMTPSDLEKYNGQKSKAVLQVFRFVTLWQDKFPTFRPPSNSEVLDKHFYYALFISLLNPALVGFTPGGDAVALSKLTSYLEQLLRLLLNHLEEEELFSLKEVLRKLLAKPEFNILNLHSSLAGDMNNINIQSLISLVNGYELLHKKGLLLNALSSGDQSPSAFAKLLLNSLLAKGDDMSPLQLLVARQVFKLTFALGIHASSLLECLDDSPKESEEEADKSKTLSDSKKKVGKADRSAASSSSSSSASSQKKKNNQGQVFYKNFQNQVDEHILNNFQAFGKRIVTCCHKSSLMFRILLNVIEVAKTNYSHSRISTDLLKELSLHISSFTLWFKTDSQPEQKENIIEFCRRILRLDSETALDTEEPLFNFFKSAFTSFFSRSTPLSIKVSALDLLPRMLSLPQPHLDSVVKSKLNELVVYDFPVKSCDLPKSSSIYTEYIAALDKLLRALENSGSIILLEVLLPMLREKNHTHGEAIDKALQHFIANIDDDKAKEAFEFAFSWFQDSTHQSDLRRAVVEKIALPLFYKLSITYASDIISTHIKTIMDIISGSTVPQPHLQPEEKKTILVEKICAFRFVEALYECLPPSIIKDKGILLSFLVLICPTVLIFTLPVVQNPLLLSFSLALSLSLSLALSLSHSSRTLYLSK
jgi:DNA-dependent protein kinase catalytic subunit